MIAMDSRGSLKQTWQEFSDGVAGAARVPQARITPGTRLIEDLDLDSLALTEVIVVLISDFGFEQLDDELGDRVWEGVTVGDLFDEYVRGRPGLDGAGAPERG
jgi:acyl carrier protein